MLFDASPSWPPSQLFPQSASARERSVRRCSTAHETRLSWLRLSVPTHEGVGESMSEMRDTSIKSGCALGGYFGHLDGRRRHHPGSKRQHHAVSRRERRHCSQARLTSARTIDRRPAARSGAGHHSSAQAELSPTRSVGDIRTDTGRLIGQICRLGERRWKSGLMSDAAAVSPLFGTRLRRQEA